MKSILLFALLSASNAHADNFQDSLIQDAWSGNELHSAISQELSQLDARKAAAVSAYNDLGAKLGIYNGWCSTYGLTALRKIYEARLYGKLFSFASYPFFHVYSNDPYFAPARAVVSQAFEELRTTRVDLGKCLLTEDMVIRMSHDPKNFDPQSDEFSGPSFPYALLAGNLRLIEEERSILLELKGVIAGARKRDNDDAVEQFIAASFRRLQEQTNMLRARTLQGYEFSFRVPLGPLEVYNGKNIGHSDLDKVPGFFSIFERRAFYVNQARVAAGKFFEVSVNSYSQAEKIQDRFLAIIREAAAR